MKISLAWLSQYIDLQGMTPEELAFKLTMSGLEVSNIDRKAAGLDRVIVGRLKSVAPHPNADKLSLTEVEVPGQILRVVCGAKNIAAGDVVPVALEGAVLPNGLAIKRAKIRGEESQGMLCSQRELGVSEEHAGIMHFPAETGIGTPVATVLGMDDVVLEVEVTPNRADCLSHLGIARHAAAVLGRPLRLPSAGATESAPQASEGWRVEIEPHCGCRRYRARLIEGVKIGPSPEWMKKRLEAVGLRSINNVVDVTNYILMDIGHPLHAFDRDRLAGGLIQARKAKPGESLRTLDGEKREFKGGELIIADAEKPVAIAGVMGGAETEVTETTVNVLLESAWFDPSEVRRSVRATNCASESSYRFERGTDPELGLTLALDQAARLIAELAGGQIRQGAIDQYPEPLVPRKIALRLEKAERVLGLPLEPVAALEALARLGYVQESEQGRIYELLVPSFRQDVFIEEDLIEDIAEVTGYDQIPLADPLVRMSPLEIPAGRELLQEARQLSAGCGLSEIITYSFIDPAHFDRLRLPVDHAWRNTVRLLNPLNEETSQMRPSLLPGLIATLSYNQRRDQERIFLFETGAVFLPSGRELPDEPTHWGAIMTGPQSPRWWQNNKPPLADFYQLKGILEELAGRLNLGPIVFQTDAMPFLHPKVSFKVRTAGGIDLGWAGQLHPEAQEAYKLRSPVLAAELDLAAIQGLWSRKPGVKSFSRFPSLVRDIALAVPEATQAGAVIQAIRRAGGESLIAVKPFDWYQGAEPTAEMGPGVKSLAFSLTFQAMDRTLQDEEVNALQAKIVSDLQAKFGARQR